jgi:hypothetical protein
MNIAYNADCMEAMREMPDKALHTLGCQALYQTRRHNEVFIS